jgi:hypothetical protein
MDSFDFAFLWVMLSLPPLVIILTYIFRSCYNELIAIHLTIFWAQLFGYGAIWLVTNQESSQFPTWIILLLGFELSVYFGAFVILGRPLRRFVRTISEAALEVRARVLLFWIVLSAGLHIFILATYGVIALVLYADVAQSAGMPSYLRYLNELLAIPAWGAVFCCCIQVAYRRFRLIHLFAVAYVLMRLFVEGGGGKSEMVLVVAVVALFGRHRPLRITWRVMSGAMATVFVLFAIWGLYEGVRHNLRSMFFTGQRYDSSVDMVEGLVTTQGGDSFGLVEKNVEGRAAPIFLLAKLTERPHLAGGAYVLQAFYNVIPSALGKTETRHENEVLADAMEFPFDDYPWTLLSEIQAETSALAALLTPLLFLGLFWLHWSVIARWRGRSEMLVLVAIGIVVFEAGQVQMMLTTILVYLRALGIYIAARFVWWNLRQIFCEVNRRVSYCLMVQYD